MVSDASNTDRDQRGNHWSLLLVDAQSDPIASTDIPERPPKRSDTDLAAALKMIYEIDPGDAALINDALDEALKAPKVLTTELRKSALERAARLGALSAWLKESQRLEMWVIESSVVGVRLKLGRKPTSPSLSDSSSSEAIWRVQQQLKKRSVSLVDGGGAVTS
ncbi:hypothetical protein XI00_05835 [Bradyrhizobium sp. CCBAU 21359]|uniref:hypothetical protein n=1 Tax=Bradyrhizobium sp. CCBAU 21359 TaxID=1325080 RepID=UPI002306C3F0|nr:hypothetical protein [Bradyrhizobium sp. CCBAU 21359]MDA9453793.1 hypothetical protein [Bradyrhizobium sp. CCBAU 21359]